MRSRRPRRWETNDENDPLAGLVNLFDLWMVFSIALLIVFVGSSQRRDARTKTAADSQPVAVRKAQTIDRFRLSNEDLQGSGEKLGVAYRLDSGEIVCVPETPQAR